MIKSKNFSDRVIEVVKKIPKGAILTYAQVAKRAGTIGAARAVGSIMAKNKDKNIPCHRVVKSDGSIGQYNNLRGASKMNVLKREGVKFTKNNKVIFK